MASACTGLVMPGRNTSIRVLCPRDRPGQDSRVTSVQSSTSARAPTA
jgi:hypothetical protein